jgi:hypothetical protein
MASRPLKPDHSTGHIGRQKPLFLVSAAPPDVLGPIANIIPFSATEIFMMDAVKDG